MRRYLLSSLGSLLGLETTKAKPVENESLFEPQDSTTVALPAKPGEWTIPLSKWSPMCHPNEEAVTHEVDEYFLAEWKFPNERGRKTFVNAGFSRVTCLYFPLAKDDRIHFACRLLTLLFLIDDLLEDMSFEEGKVYNERLMPIMHGDVLPNRSDPAEYITYDLWESMRDHDIELANSIVEPVITFMRAQTDKARLEIHELGTYLEYREKDVGKALLSALMRFCMNIHLTDEELQAMQPFERNCSKHLSVVNDIYSWEKEVESSKTRHKEGAALCSAVKVIAESTNLSVQASKRVLWSMTREWELVHDELRTEAEKGHHGDSQRVKNYIKGLEYQMSGNELWSRTTLRYKTKV